MTTLFENETVKPEAEGTPYQEMPPLVGTERGERACTRCGQAINTQREGWRSSPTGIAHVTCPTSAAIRDLPELQTEEAQQLIQEIKDQRAIPEHDYMTKQEAAALLRVHVNTISNKIKAGELPAVRLKGGQSILLDRRDVLALLEPVRVGQDLAAPMAADFTRLERDFEEATR